MKQIEPLKKHVQTYENFHSLQIVESMPSEIEVMNKINEIIELVNELSKDKYDRDVANGIVW
ncbi:hypothetical protein HOBO_26 [Bacillus phage Hobo]|uniref:Uncharacterized protein n=2 Tax=Caeruleovirus BM15 TaxID=1985178 RepID=A0A0S2MU96_9CAUD|nr:hypothetical protein FD732_gp026 [Bacillus phage BM15]ALO79447.1 hypothetical protein BM10_26 [Bacillus phage BM15]AXQ66807.1 hypothetical protein HOBO_26 [Bacillus phage Hobo]